MNRAGRHGAVEAHVFKSDRVATTVLERYEDFLRRWPVHSDKRFAPTREGQTFVVSSGPK